MSRAERWQRFVPDRERLGALRHRWHRVLVLSAATGAITSLGVVAFKEITENVALEHVLELPDPLLVVAPAVGLVLAWALLRFLGRRATPGISDEYLRAYHGRPCRTDGRAFGSRVAASVATLGSGGAMGFEGPAIFIGASVGRRIQEQFHRFFREQDRHVLLVAGAAAGVAAIFKAPATGAIFALEVPYQQDTASHAVLPALIASASSYLVFVVFEGTTRLFPVAGSPGFNATDLLGAIGIGLLCGVGARGFAALILRAKQAQRRLPTPVALAIAGGGLALLAVVTLLVFDLPLSLGPGYSAIEWAQDPTRSVGLIVGLLAVRVVATTLAVGGGGAGGLFIPLFVQGWLVGAAVEGIASTNTSLFPVIGAAAFLGAGYRTPLAAVVFVAEATGRPGFIVPALLATAVAQLLMGTRSVTEYQVPRRLSALDRRLEQPVSVVTRTAVPRCPSDTTVAALIDAAGREALVPIVDDGRYVGLVPVATVGAAVAPEERSTTPVSRWIEKVEPVPEDATLRELLDELRRRDVEQLPVVDGSGDFRGLARAVDIPPDGG